MGTARRGPSTLPFAPTPLQVRMPEKAHEDGAYREFYCIWKASEARHCGRCPLRLCTLEDVPETDTATCVVVMEERCADRFAVALGVAES